MQHTIARANGTRAVNFCDRVFRTTMLNSIFAACYSDALEFVNQWRGEYAIENWECLMSIHG